MDLIKQLKKVFLTLFLTFVIAIQSAMAGNILLTGHDVLLHSGQNGYDDVILGYLANGRATGSMDIAVIGSGLGYWSFGGGGTVHSKAGYSSTTYYDTTTMTAADWTSALMSDLFIYLSHNSCGGCDTSNAGVVAVNDHSAAIATAFNGGMDIWANSGAGNMDYYNFLPPGVVASGSSISGNSGFTATAAGSAIGIVSTNINGFPTHNRFSSSAGAFTVLETRVLSASTEIITIGLLGGFISGGGITTGVPEPETIALFALGLLALRLNSKNKKGLH